MTGEEISEQFDRFAESGLTECDKDGMDPFTLPFHLRELRQGGAGKLECPGWREEVRQIGACCGIVPINQASSQLGVGNRVAKIFQGRDPENGSSSKEQETDEAEGPGDSIEAKTAGQGVTVERFRPVGVRLPGGCVR